MNAEKLYYKILSRSSKGSFELPTVPSNARKPIWFKVCLENGVICVDNAETNSPSCKLKMSRQIKLKDFITGHSYYEIWDNGDTGIRQEARLKSLNLAYIFSLIKNCS